MVSFIYFFFLQLDMGSSEFGLMTRGIGGNFLVSLLILETSSNKIL